MNSCNLRIFGLLAFLAFSSAKSVQAVDLNHDGMDDVWHQLYGAGSVNASGDGDGDGHTDYQESVAGTNPHSADSRFNLNAPVPVPSDLKVEWYGYAGKRYQVEASTNLIEWLAIDTVDPLTNGLQVVHFPASASSRFHRVLVSDLDSDGDQVTDWAERLTGFDPNLGESTPGQPDLAALEALLSTPTTVSVEAIAPTAYERGTFDAPVAGRVLLRRSGGLRPFDARYVVSGSAVAGVDYQEALSGLASFGFGQRQVELPVTPILDPRLEIVRRLVLDLSSDPAYAAGATTSATVRIEDASDARDLLLYGVFSPLAGVETTASGYAAVLVDADRTTARVIVNFSSLLSAQTAAQVQLSTTGDAVRSLPPGSFSGHQWVFPLTGSGSLVSDQSILDELLGGRLWITIFTADHPAGEIRALLRRSEGSVSFVPPPEPPVVETFTGRAAERDVMRFLSQATFGPTEALAQAVAARGFAGWMDDQMNTNLTPRTILRDYAMAADDWMMHSNDVSASPSPFFHPDNVSLYDAWWTTAIQGNDQLRQRVAYALSQIFVVSTRHDQLRKWHYGTLDYWDMLARHAFGNLRDILSDVSVHPAMANYLSMIKNEPYNPTTGASPDENYAREIMQLFSIGLVHLHPDGSLKLDATSGLPIPTYNNHDITEMARVFTGWGYSKRQTGGDPTPTGWDNNGVITENTDFYYQPPGPKIFAQAAYFHPLRMFDDHHDTGGKTLVGGRVLPGGQTGEQDLADAVDTLFDHPTFTPFIAVRLIQRMVTSNPSPGYVHRVVRIMEDDGQGVRGNLAATVRAILLDPEARSQRNLEAPGTGKKREPLLAFTHMVRALKGNSLFPVASTLGPYGFNAVSFPATATQMRFIFGRESTGQSPIGAPSVFNWWLPSYSLPGPVAEAGLLSPEFMIANEANSISLANVFTSPFWKANGQTQGLAVVPADAVPSYPSGNSMVVLDTSTARSALISGGVDALLDHLDLLFCQGTLSPASRTLIRDAVNATGAIANSSANEEKVRTALCLILNSPDYVIQR